MAKSSPFEVIHKRLEANFAEYDGWTLVSDYGDSAAEECALGEGCAAFDLCSFGRLEVKGPKSGAVLEKLLAGADEQLPEGGWIWSLVNDSASHTGFVVRVAEVEGCYMVMTMPAERQAVLEQAQKCAADFGAGEVSVDDITEKTGMLGIYGPAAMESIGGLLSLDIDTLEIGRTSKMSLFMISLTLMRGSWAGLDGLEVICPVSVAPLAAGAVAKYYKKADIVPAGMECLMRAIGGAKSPKTRVIKTRKDDKFNEFCLTSAHFPVKLAGCFTGICRLTML